MGRQAVKSDSLLHGLPGYCTGLLNPRGSSLPDLLVHGKPGLHVVCEAVLIGENDAESGGVFNGLTGSLGLMRLPVLQGLRKPTRERVGGFNSPSLGAQRHP